MFEVKRMSRFAAVAAALFVSSAPSLSAQESEYQKFLTARESAGETEYERGSRLAREDREATTAAVPAFAAKQLGKFEAKPCDVTDADIETMVAKWVPMGRGVSEEHIEKNQRYEVRNYLVAKSQEMCRRKNDGPTSELEAFYHLLRTSDCTNARLPDLIAQVPATQQSLSREGYNALYGYFSGHYGYGTVLKNSAQDKCVAETMSRALFAKSLKDLR